jgi:hypothetical protein
MDKLKPDAVALLDAIGQANVARALGVSRQAVNKWRRHGVPPDRADDLRKAFPRAGWTKWPKAVGKGRSAQ